MFEPHTSRRDSGLVRRSVALISLVYGSETNMSARNIKSNGVKSNAQMNRTGATGMRFFKIRFGVFSQSWTRKAKYSLCVSWNKFVYSPRGTKCKIRLSTGAVRTNAKQTKSDFK